MAAKHETSLDYEKEFDYVWLMTIMRGSDKQGQKII